MIFLSDVFAHCDGIDGPVVQDAKKSLNENNVNYVLLWIQPEYEQEVRNTFSQVMSVRNLNAETKEVADYYFFETVVRLHRLGEGEPYTGLKPTGTEISPAVVQADLSIEDGDLLIIESLLLESVKESIEEKYKTVMDRSDYNPENVEAAREYVEAYINFIHYAEKVFELSQNQHSHELH